MTVWTQPLLEREDAGDVKDYKTGLGDRIGAEASDALAESPTAQSYRTLELSDAMSGDEFGRSLEHVMKGGDLNDVPAAPMTSKDQAQARVKEAGLEKAFKLPDMDEMPTRALDIMIERARTRQERNATIARGPEGFIPGALSVGTSFLVGAVDPINVASAFIPVVGEMRYAKIMADAGEGIAARALARAPTGVASGAVGALAIEPINARSRLLEGQDYHMAHALQNVIFGAALGGILHTGGGAVADLYRSRRGRPMFPYDLGEPMESHTPWADLRTRQDSARAAEGMPERFEDAARQVDARRGGTMADDFPEMADQPDFAPVEVSRETPFIASPIVDAIDDLPPRAREDAMRASIAAIVNGEPVRAADIIEIGAQTDPRIAESLQAGRLSAMAADADLSPEGREVFDDIRGQLTAAGLAPEEAGANAALVAARYEARAARLGGAAGTAADLYRAEGIRVQANDGMKDPLGGRTLDQRRTQRPPARGLPGQMDLLGTAPISDAELAQRRANEPLRPGVAQKPMDEGLFGDSAQQTDLVDEARKAQRELFQPPTVPTFYSAVSRAVGNSKLGKGSADQWMATLRNTPGVKSEELKWLGVEDWLKDQDGPVTKAEVEKFIAANNIEVKETQRRSLTGRDNTPPDAIAEQEYGARWQKLVAEMQEINLQVMETFQGKNVQDRPALLQEKNRVQAAMDELHDQMVDDTYYLRGEGAERIKEAKEFLRKDVGEDPDEAFGFNDQKDYIAAAHGRGMPDKEPKYASYTLPGGENYREVLLTLPEKDRVTREPSKSPAGWGDIDGGNVGFTERGNTGADFRSSHWEEPNVLAHVRLNDRVIDGKKTLLVEEVQSDWHQSGRKRGYRTEESKREAQAKADEAMNRAVAINAEMSELAKDRDPVSNRIREEAKWLRLATERDRANDEMREASRLVSGGVPDAPFKTTWPELAMKRIIRMAAEHGYEKVAWVPGEVQAERYDLSKQISRINYQRTGTDRYAVEALDHSDKTVMHKDGVSGAELEGMVGKDVAQKIIDGSPEYRLWNHLEGLDLKVGGEGMRGFYDKILPATVGKLVKKFGAKVGEDALPPEAEVKIRPARDTGGGWEVYRTSDEFVLHRTNGRDGAQSFADDYRGKTVHSFDVTPELKKAATEEGFPLFQREQDEMRGRITMADNEAIIDLFEKSDRSTFMHEMSHLWLDELARDSMRAGVPPGLVDDMAITLKWLGAERADAITTEQHEQWARAFEQYLQDGKAPTPALQGVFAQFKDWLTSIYRAVVGGGDVQVSDEIRGVFDRLLAATDQAASQQTAAPPQKRGPGPKGRDPETYSLLEFLASRGGIRNDDPLIGDVTGSVGTKKFIPGFGTLIRKPKELSTAARMGGAHAPMTLDDARAAAVEAGYLHDPGDLSGGEATTTIADLLNLIDQEARGQRVYREGRQLDAKPEDLKRLDEEHRAHAEREIVSELRAIDEVPENVPQSIMDRTIEIMVKEGERDALIAYERAVMSETLNEQATHGADRVQEHLPGWYVHDDAGAAPAAGGAFESVGQSRRSAARQAAREPGAGDRPAGGRGDTPGTGGGEWKRLADVTPEYNDPAVLARSEAAAAIKEPASASPKLNERLKAAEDAEARAIADYDLAAPYLPPDLREQVDAQLAAMERERMDYDHVVKQGVGCLAAGIGMGATI